MSPHAAGRGARREGTRGAGPAAGQALRGGSRRSLRSGHPLPSHLIPGWDPALPESPRHLPAGAGCPGGGPSVSGSPATGRAGPGGRRCVYTATGAPRSAAAQQPVAISRLPTCYTARRDPDGERGRRAGAARPGEGGLGTAAPGQAGKEGSREAGAWRGERRPEAAGPAGGRRATGRGAAGLQERARPLLPRPGSRRRGREAAPGAPGPREPPPEEAAAASVFWRRAGRAAGAEVRRGLCVGSSEEERGAGVARAVRGPAEP